MHHTGGYHYGGYHPGYSNGYYPRYFGGFGYFPGYFGGYGYGGYGYGGYGNGYYGTGYSYPYSGYGYSDPAYNAPVYGTQGPAAAYPDPSQGRYLGIDQLAVVDGGVPGMQVVGVYPGSPAEQAGLHAGDVIHSANGYLTQEAGNLPWIIANTPPSGVLQMNVRTAKRRPGPRDQCPDSLSSGSATPRAQAVVSARRFYGSAREMLSSRRRSDVSD